MVFRDRRGQSARKRHSLEWFAILSLDNAWGTEHEEQHSQREGVSLAPSHSDGLTNLVEKYQHALSGNWRAWDLIAGICRSRTANAHQWE